MLQSMRSAAKYIWVFIFIFFVGGFLLLDTSGLLGRDQLTPTTAVGSVNGRQVLYQQWLNATRGAQQQQEQRLGRSLTLDEIRQVEDQAFDQIVADMLLEEEYERRGIRVSADEIRAAANYAPPPWLMQSPELQTEGRFDPEKYRRLRESPSARASGLNVALESYYRTEIPRQKLLAQIAAGVYITDAQLWRRFQDQADSAQVSFVSLRPDTIADSAVTVSDRELQDYYDAHRDDLERPGRAVVSVVSIPRVVSAADSAAVRSRIGALRAEIAGGAKFEDVAKRESADSGSAVEGGLLPPSTRGSFVPEFERAGYGLRTGELSQPVLTQFGYHLLRLDERKGDTLTLRHILLRIEQSDSSAAITGRRADELARIAEGTDEPARFDSAARTLGLPVTRAVAFEGEPLVAAGRYVPSISAWAFGGARVGETSDLIDGEDGYYLARLDSLTPGGVPRLDAVRDEIRRLLAREKKVQMLVPAGQSLAQEASRSSLEQAAAAKGATVEKSPLFSRLAFVPQLGRLNEAIGAAFALPVGAVSEPIVTDEAVIVLRVDRRINADRAAFETQKETLRSLAVQQLRQRAAQEYVTKLRAAADVEDNRREVTAAAALQAEQAQGDQR